MKTNKYYEASIYLTTEELWLNPKTGAYEGCDPDTFQDCGVVYTFTGTLEKIKKEIYRTLVKLESWEYDAENNTLVWSCEGEHDYRTPIEDRVPFIETYTLYLSELTEVSQDPRTLVEEA